MVVGGNPVDPGDIKACAAAAGVNTLMSGSSLLPFQPSLAQATNTRIDSACNHIQQCRVSTDDMMRFVGGNTEEIVRNKYRYCVHKDELVVGVGRPW